MRPVPIPLPALPEAPLVSVLVASYNYARYLPEALDSLLRQSYRPFEAVIVDDGSTDASPRIAAEFARRDARFHLLEQPNGGVASALNAAYARSRGGLICLLDADDVFAPDKLARVVAACRVQPRAGLVLHGLTVIDAASRQIGRLPAFGAAETGWLGPRLRARGGRWRSLPAGALTFRREAADLLFPIPEPTFRSEADGFLNTLAPLLTEVAFLPEPLAAYRLHGANLTGTQRLDAATTARHLDALHRKIDAANERLGALGLGPPLDLARNLNAREHAFLRDLFAGMPRRRLAASFVDLARALLADDLYRPARKALGLFAYAGALLLPTAARPAWLTHMLAAPTLRRLLARLPNA